MKCYYHDDLDGQCAGYIVYKHNPTCEMIMSTYEKEIDIEAIQKDETIYIVDFSFKPNVMNEILLITKNIIWIDHHGTAFNYEKEYHQELSGFRHAELSGCELTWLWFEKEQKEPGFWNRWWQEYNHDSELPICTLRELCNEAVWRLRYLDACICCRKSSNKNKG